MSIPRTLTAVLWQELYQRLEKPLYNLAYRYVWSAPEAQDVVHDAFLQVWERRDRIDATTADRYLWVAVLNQARKRRRWARAKRFLPWEDVVPELPAISSVEAENASVQEAKSLHDAVESLPEKLRTVLLMTEFSEMKYEDIAQLLAIPAGTVASRRNLAIKRLRECTRSMDA